MNEGMEVSTTLANAARFANPRPTRMLGHLLRFVAPRSTVSTVPETCAALAEARYTTCRRKHTCIPIPQCHHGVSRVVSNYPPSLSEAATLLTHRISDLLGRRCPKRTALLAPTQPVTAASRRHRHSQSPTLHLLAMRQHERGDCIGWQGRRSFTPLSPQRCQSLARSE